MSQICICEGSIEDERLCWEEESIDHLANLVLKVLWKKQLKADVGCGGDDASQDHARSECAGVHAQCVPPILCWTIGAKAIELEDIEVRVRALEEAAEKTGQRR